MLPSTARLLGDTAGSAAPVELRRIGPAAGHTPLHAEQSPVGFRSRNILSSC